ncbi:MAG: T9SS type A sorting domain-containing protein, partial [Bacteroidota bacterium]
QTVTAYAGIIGTGFTETDFTDNGATADVFINSLPAIPVISAGGAIALCTGGSVSLSTTYVLQANEAYLWSNGATTSSVSVNTSGSYTLQIRNTSTLCTSAASAAIAVTVNPLPAQPTITGTAAICLGKINTLTSSATAANEVYLWSTGATTQTIQVSTAGTYTVQKINTVTACTSAVSAGFVTTLNTTATAPAFTDGMAYAGTLARSGVYSIAISSKGVKALGTSSGVLIYPTPDATTGAITLTYSSITYCAFSPDGTKLLVSSGGSNRVDIYNTIPTVNNQAPDLVIGQTDIAGTGSGTSATQMTTPGALAVSPDGRLLICERGNSRVLIYNSIPTANGASADMVLGQTDFSSYVGGLSASKFFTPYGIAVSAAGKVLLADQFNRVLIWNTFPTANGQAADYVIGQSTFTANTAATTQTGLNTSYGVAISATGKVAIADALNNRVLIYNSIPAANGVAASNVLGQALFTTSSTGSGSSAMNKPYCVAFTPEGRLMVGENGNNRVTTFGTAPCQASNLSVGLSASAASLCAGSSVTYTYTVTNPAAYAVPGTIIAAAVPAIFNYSSSATLTGSYSNTENTWTIPDLAAGATATLTVTATVPLTVGNQTVTAYAGIIGTGFTETGFSDNGSSATVTANASVVPAQPAITPVGPADFCAGGSITLTSSLSTGTYLWSTGETTQSITVSTAGNRTVQTINAAGCISEASVVKTVTVIPAPTAPAITGVSGICAGETATLSTDYVLQVNEAYLWSNGSAASSVSLGTAGSYSLRIHNTVTLCTSAVSNVIPIAVYTTPAAPGISTGMAYTSKITSLPIVRSIIISSKGVKAVGAAGLVNLYSSPDATTPYLTLSRTGGGTISCAFSPDGSKMLITEGNFNRVSIYNTLPTAGNQEPDLVIGQTNINNSSSGTTASTLNAPRKVYVLPDGKVIIADAGNHRVLVYNCIPTANGAAADLVLGQPDFVTGTSGLSSTKMTGPQGIAYSADGSLLIAEGENRRITVWNTFPAANGQAADVVIGQPDFTTNTAAITASKFSNPTGIAVSPEGKLAMTDLTGNRALLYNSIPAVNGALANIVLGQRDFISNSLYLGTTVNMVNVFGVCFTTEGRVIVGDGGNGRICTFGVPPCQQSNISVAVSASVSSLCAGTGGSVVYTFTATNPGAYAVPKVYIGAGIPGTFNYSSSTASVGSYSPAGSTWTIPSLAAGATATLTVTAYVSSTLAAQTATAYASVTGIGFTETDFTDNGASVAVSINAVPAQPAITASGTVALCTGSSVVLTASAISGGSYLWSTGATTQSITVSAALSPTVQTISAAGCTSAASVATTVTVIPLPSAPSVSAGSATAFCSGGSVTLTSSAISGGSYIWSTGATTQAITVNTTLSPTVRTVNAQGCTSAASTAVAVTVNSALTAPTVSASRNTALCLGESVTLAAPGPNFNVLAGVGYGYVDGQGAEAAFDWPTGMAIDAAGNIFVSEPYINRIRKITPSGYVSTFAGNGNRGHADGNVTQAEFDNPAGLTFDAAGNLYVANWQSGIINKITPAGQVSTLPGVYSRPYGLALDAAGNLFISEQIGGTISKLTPAGNISIFAGSGNDGFANGTGTAAEFKEPSGMVFDASGNLYVADSRNNAIRIINPAGVVSTFAGNGLSGTADGNDSSASFSYPQGITIDSRGNFYVADVNNVSIRKITPAGKVSTVGSAARPLTYSGPNSESPITYPSDVAIDPSGELVIVENNNNRIFTTTGVSTAYHWNNGENTDTINANTTGNYTLQTITLQGCTSLASPVISVRVTSAAEPVLAVGLVSGANPACIGTPLTFSAAVSDSGSNTAYQWTRNGVNIAGATSAAYTALAGAQLTDGDVINCKFTGQNCNGATAATGTAFSLRTNLTGTWLGNTDAWSNAANWCGGIPTATTDVVLPAGMNTTPNITLGTAVCRDISLSAGTSLPLASGGKLTVYGNVSGEGRLAGAQGSIIEIAGSTQQTLHGGKAGSIRLNNPAGLVLSFATEVTDAIVLVSGNIDATNYPLILSAGAANPVESSAGRIQGRVTARGRATGTGTLSMLGVSIAAGTDDIDTVYIERRDETATYLSNTGIAQVWSIRAGHQPVSGRTVTLSWLPSRSNYKSLAAAQVWRRPEADTRWLKVGNLQSIANASLSPAISVSTNSFSDWTVSDTDNPLPVTWLSFTGKRQALTNQLRWSTASEQENKGFVVQRSLNGIQFDSIDFVPGNGTTTRVNNYSYTDLYAESAYYRLNQIDQNGQSSLSNVIFINGGKANVVPELYPNPGSSYVYITGISETAQVQLISAEGKVLQVLSTDKNQGIYIGNLSSGMYTYKVVTASGVYIGKLVKE